MSFSRCFYNVLLLTLGLSLVACQSPQQLAGSDHKLVVDKWLALSKYANGTLNKHNFTIGAKLKLLDEKFVLTDFQLLRAASATHIDLLRPSFEQKLLCNENKDCSLLTQYINNDVTNATLLTQFFDESEFELFNFYGELVVLDDQFKKLGEIDKNNFINYFNYLINQEEKVTSIKTFTDYLSRTLSEQQFIDFLNEPEKTYDFVKKSVVENKVDWQEEEAIEFDSNFVALELQNIEEFEVNIIEETSFENEKGKHLIQDENNAVKVNIETALLSKSVLTTEEIFIGDNVCSYKDNYVGVVTQVQGKRFTVYVVGQLQGIEDNILTTAPSGAIFSEPFRFSFNIIKEVKELNQDDIALCDVEISS